MENWMNAYLKKLIFTLIIVLNGFGVQCYAQNYSEYYQLINRAEEKFILQKDTTCFYEYDIAFEKYDPYLKDVYIAGQIALYFGDTTKFFNYLKLCFQNGMPITAVNASPIIKAVNINEGLSSQISELYKSSFVPPIVDEKIYDEICLKCYQSDSIKTFMYENDSLIRLFNENEKRTREYLLENFLELGTFPNERLIGITTDKMHEDFYKEQNRPDFFKILTGKSGHHNEEFGLRANCPFNIVLHSKCFFRENRELFMNALINGYLHPMDFGVLDETSILWHHSEDNIDEVCGPPKVRICYNIFGYNPINPTFNVFTNTEEGLKEVEINRQAIYMQKYSIDLLKKKMESEYGFKFFFDFQSR